MTTETKVAVDFQVDYSKFPINPNQTEEGLTYAQLITTAPPAIARFFVINLAMIYATMATIMTKAVKMVKTVTVTTSTGKTITLDLFGINTFITNRKVTDDGFQLETQTIAPSIVYSINENGERVPLEIDDEQIMNFMKSMIKTVMLEVPQDQRPTTIPVGTVEVNETNPTMGHLTSIDITVEDVINDPSIPTMSEFKFTT